MFCDTCYFVPISKVLTTSDPILISYLGQSSLFHLAPSFKLKLLYHLLGVNLHLFLKNPCWSWSPLIGCFGFFLPPALRLSSQQALDCFHLGGCSKLQTLSFMNLRGGSSRSACLWLLWMLMPGFQETLLAATCDLADCRYKSVWQLRFDAAGGLKAWTSPLVTYEQLSWPTFDISPSHCTSLSQFSRAHFSFIVYLYTMMISIGTLWRVQRYYFLLVPPPFWQPSYISIVAFCGRWRLFVSHLWVRFFPVRCVICHQEN